MVDVKVCSKCGASIPSQEIIGGKAKLVGGQLFCGDCATASRSQAPASSAAPPRAQAPAGAAAARPPASATAAPAAAKPAAATPPVSLPKDEPLALPPDDEPADPSTADEPLALEENNEEASEIIVRGKTGTRQVQTFKREPKSNGMGAVRVRSFDSKLTRSALQVMDEQINAWLDETGYEVKFVTTTIGDIQGKVTESHLILNLWY